MPTPPLDRSEGQDRGLVVAPSSGEALVEWYRGLFSALSTLGTLGAGFTLSVVVQQSSQNNAAGFKPSAVTTWAAISSTLFVLTVLVAQGCSQFFKFEQGAIAAGLDDDDPNIKRWLFGLSLVLQCQVILAFLFLELVHPHLQLPRVFMQANLPMQVLTAHSPLVGWVGVALTMCLGVVALLLWFLQVTGRKPVETHRELVMRRKRARMANAALV